MSDAPLKIKHISWWHHYEFHEKYSWENLVSTVLAAS